MKKWMIITGVVMLLLGAVLSGMNKEIVSSGQYAMGYFASGQFAAGVFAAGQFSIGVFSIGIFSIGIFSLGIFNIGIYSLGFFLLWKKHGKKLRGFDIVQSSPKIVSFLALVCLMSVTQNASAQIPNGDFEAWVDHGSFKTPVGFATPNALSQNGTYAITQTEDVSNASEGQYAVRIESEPKMLPQANAYGLMLQNPEEDFLTGIQPSFAVAKHYVQLTGRIKYFPDNGDALLVLVLMFKEGEVVAQGTLSSTDTIANWSDFSLNISNYQDADSCALLLGAYYAMGGPPEYVPHGNSVLYIDDLELKGGTASVEMPYEENLRVYPNPSTGVLHVETRTQTKEVKLFNAEGVLMLVQQPDGRTMHLDLQDFHNGVYYLQVEEEQTTVIKRVVLSR